MAICPLRPDLPAALLMSVGDSGVASNYHWRADTPDRVNYKTLDDALTLCSWVVNRLTPKPKMPWLLRVARILARLAVELTGPRS